MNRFLFGGGNEEVPIIESTAAMAGFDVVELMWIKGGVKRGGSVAKLHGFEAPAISKSRNLTFDDSADNLVKSRMRSTTVRFYPDGDNFNFGYVVDTPNNRKRMARNLKTGWYRIQNAKLREEIKKLARELGEPTSPLEKPKVNIKKTVREIKAEQEVKKVNAAVDERDKKIEDLEKVILDMQEKGVAKLEKPLSHVHINKDKIPLDTRTTGH